MPSSCQGILAVQGRRGVDYSFLKDFHCSNTHYIAKGERSFAKALIKKSYSEIAVYGEIIENRLHLRDLGFHEGIINKASVVGGISDGDSLGNS